ncbi:MAG: ABC transporter permease [Armatimonadetes bacterium]|nr:ABC transporter permease [Armatimonadota bacterium]
MRLLLLKALRDLRQGWLSFGACGLLVTLAIALFLAFASSQRNIQQTCDVTYKQLKFLDFFLEVHGAPAMLDVQIGQIRGVEAAVGRNVVPVSVLKMRPGESPHRAQPMQGQAISVPVDSRPPVNDVLVEEGRYLAAHRGEVLLEKRFASIHGYRVGDRLTIKRQDRVLGLTIVGLVSSPEFIWLCNDRYNPRPAAHRLAIMYISGSDAASLSGQRGPDEIHVRVSRPEDRERAMAEVAQRAAGYLVLHPIPREEQASHALLIRDQRAFAVLAIIFPGIFLSLSTMILFSTMWQLVTRQRHQIGVMMSQGLAGTPIALHYVAIAAVVGGGGAVAGLVAGQFVGRACTGLYSRILGVSLVVNDFYPELHLSALAAAIVVAVAAGWLATRRVLKKEPLEALRPEFSTQVRSFHPERLLPILGRLGLVFRLPLRNLLRNPLRTAITVAGTGFAIAQIVMAWALYDSQKAALDFFFSRVHTYNLQANLKGVLSPSALPPVEHWPGVLRVEKYLRQSIRVEHGSRSMEVAAWGIPPDARLLTLFDYRRRPLRVGEGSSLLMGTVLLGRLGVQPDEQVKVTVLNGDNPEPPTRTFRLGPELYEPVPNPAKLPLRQLQRLGAATWGMPPDGVNVLLLKVSPSALEPVRERLYSSGQIREVLVLEQMEAEIQELLRMANAYRAIIFFFAGLLAVGLLGATTALNMMERTLEFATLAVLGVSDRTLMRLVITETVILWALGMIIGIPCGLLLGEVLLNHYAADFIQMRLWVQPSTLIQSGLAGLGICLMAITGSLRAIQRLPLTETTAVLVD